jgi:rRNA maturation endonuclease Nob1
MRKFQMICPRCEEPIPLAAFALSLPIDAFQSQFPKGMTERDQADWMLALIRNACSTFTQAEKYCPRCGGMPADLRTGT